MQYAVFLVQIVDQMTALNLQIFVILWYNRSFRIVQWFEKLGNAYNFCKRAFPIFSVNIILFGEKPI